MTDPSNKERVRQMLEEYAAAMYVRRVGQDHETAVDVMMQYLFPLEAELGVTLDTKGE